MKFPETESLGVVNAYVPENVAEALASGKLGKNVTPEPEGELLNEV